MLATPPGSWRPLLGEILDPPLIGTDVSILSYVKMMSYAKDMIPDICGQYLNNSELHKY